MEPSRCTRMPDTRIAPSPAHPARMKLESYSAEIRLSNLTLGVDNIHYDVFLSPRFVDFTRKYLLDLVRQKINISLFYGKDRKHSGAPEHGAFRKLLTEVLQASLTRAKFQQSIETDILHQLALVKSSDLRNRQPIFKHIGGMQGLDPFARRIIRAQRAGARDARENRGDSGGQKKYLSRSGRHSCRIWREVEEGTLSKTRRALFGEDFHDTYELLQNRFLFVENGNDDHLFLEHYVLLGNFVNDPDRFEIFDGILLDFVRDLILTGDDADESSKARKAHERLLEQARQLRSEMARLEEELEEATGRAGEGDGLFPSIFKRKGGASAESRAELEGLPEEIRGQREKSGRAGTAD